MMEWVLSYGATSSDQVLMVLNNIVQDTVKKGETLLAALSDVCVWWYIGGWGSLKDRN